jgi:hypothetical protein
MKDSVGVRFSILHLYYDFSLLVLHSVNRFEPDYFVRNTMKWPVNLTFRFLIKFGNFLIAPGTSYETRLTLLERVYSPVAVYTHK